MVRLLPQQLQGALEIVQLMFQMQPHEKNIVLTCTDAQKMTPLHCAAMFDYPEVTEYLIKEGALSRVNCEMSKLVKCKFELSQLFLQNQLVLRC